jgi:hypothetical protein
VQNALLAKTAVVKTHRTMLVQYQFSEATKTLVKKGMHECALATLNLCQLQQRQ